MIITPNSLLLKAISNTIRLRKNHGGTSTDSLNLKDTLWAFGKFILGKLINAGDRRKEIK